MENNEKRQPEVMDLRVPHSRVKINVDDCDLCGACVLACRRGVLAMGDGRIDIVDGKYCNECEACVKACANRAINLE